MASPPMCSEIRGTYFPASGRFPWFAFFMRNFFSLRRRVLAMVPPRSGGTSRRSCYKSY